MSASAPDDDNTGPPTSTAGFSLHAGIVACLKQIRDTLDNLFGTIL